MYATHLMKHVAPILLAVMLGCDDLPDLVLPDDEQQAQETLARLRIEQQSYTPTLSPAQGEERDLIEQVISSFTGGMRDVLRLVLMDSVGHVLYTVGDRNTDQLIRRIYELRALRRDPLRIATRIALVEQLPEPQADAVILRNPLDDPSDTVLLPAEFATGGRLAAAVAALITIRQEQGNTPTRITRVVVTGTRPPTSWSPMEMRHAERWILRLRHKPARPLDGIGDAQYEVVPLRAPPPEGETRLRGR